MSWAVVQLRKNEKEKGEKMQRNQLPLFLGIMCIGMAINSKETSAFWRLWRQPKVCCLSKHSSLSKCESCYIKGRFLMFWLFFILENSQGKRLFSTNQMARNSKTVSLLKKICSLSKETIFEFSEQRDCFQISCHLIGWKQSLSVRLF